MTAAGRVFSEQHGADCEPSCRTSGRRHLARAGERDDELAAWGHMRRPHDAGRHAGEDDAQNRMGADSSTDSPPPPGVPGTVTSSKCVCPSAPVGMRTDGMRGSPSPQPGNVR